jgi:hypothetical protein
VHAWVKRPRICQGIAPIWIYPYGQIGGAGLRDFSAGQPAVGRERVFDRVGCEFDHLRLVPHLGVFEDVERQPPMTGAAAHVIQVPDQLQRLADGGNDRRQPDPQGDAVIRVRIEEGRDALMDQKQRGGVT